LIREAQSGQFQTTNARRVQDAEFSVCTYRWPYL